MIGRDIAGHRQEATKKDVYNGLTPRAKDPDVMGDVSEINSGELAREDRKWRIAD